MHVPEAGPRLSVRGDVCERGRQCTRCKLFGEHLHFLREQKQRRYGIYYGNFSRPDRSKNSHFGWKQTTPTISSAWMAPTQLSSIAKTGPAHRSKRSSKPGADRSMLLTPVGPAVTMSEMAFHASFRFRRWRTCVDIHCIQKASECAMNHSTTTKEKHNHTSKIFGHCVPTYRPSKGTRRCRHPEPLNGGTLWRRPARRDL